VEKHALKTHPRVDLSSPFLQVFTWIHGVSVEDSREFDFELDRAVLMEDPIDTVLQFEINTPIRIVRMDVAYLVIRSSEDLRYDKLPRAGNGAASISEIGVLEENTRFLLMDTNSIFNRLSLSIAANEIGIHVVDRPFTVAPEGKTVSHITSSIFSKIERVLSLMGMLRIASKYQQLYVQDS